MNRFLQYRRDDRGVVALEVVIAASALLIIILGAVVLGNFLSVKAQASNLAREGARAAALHQPLPIDTAIVGAPCPTPTDPTRFVTVEATKDLTLSQIPFTPIDLDVDGDNELTETVTMRCGG